MESVLCDNDEFEILIATDIHLGHRENDRIRGNDSFRTFDEILSIAVEKDVDFVLLGGDLFDHNKPTLHCLHECIQILRKHCTKEKTVKFKFERDQSINIKQCTFPKVNFEDHNNLKISLPVFSIHGNHDDPTAHWQLGSLDILSAAGLVNYFGFCTDLENVEVRPLILSKGSTRIALYGLGHIRDEILSDLFIKSKVKFIPPEKDYFCILILHQNRCKRGLSENSYIKQEYLPKFFNLIIWGHEHDQKDDTIENVRVLQPGSSVTTALKIGESGEKRVFHLKVRGVIPQLSPIRLRTVRPFVFDKLHVPLSGVDSNKEKLKRDVEKRVTEHIEKMIQEATKLRTGHPNQPTLPLIRLRLLVDHKDQVINEVELGNTFKNKVADHKKVISQPVVQNKETGSEESKYTRGEQTKSVETTLAEILQKGENGKHKLQVMSVKNLLGTVKEPGAEVAAAFSKVFQNQLEDIVKEIKGIDVQKDENSVIAILKNFAVKQTSNMESFIISQNSADPLPYIQEVTLEENGSIIQLYPLCSSEIDQGGSGACAMETCDDNSNDEVMPYNPNKWKRPRESASSGDCNIKLKSPRKDLVFPSRPGNKKGNRLSDFSPQTNTLDSYLERTADSDSKK